MRQEGTEDAAPVYRRGEIVYSGVVRAAEPAAVRGALAELVQEANSATFRRGAGTITLRSDQVDGLIEAVTQTPGADLVVLSSPTNQFGGEVRVEVTAVENRKLLNRGAARRQPPDSLRLGRAAHQPDGPPGRALRPLRRRDGKPAALRPFRGRPPRPHHLGRDL